MSAPADEHRWVAGEFTATVEGVPASRWDDPAPVEGWAARDVVGHLVEWFPAFLDGSTGITLPAGPSVADAPVGAWCTQTDAVQALLGNPDTANASTTSSEWAGFGFVQVPILLGCGVRLWDGLEGLEQQYDVEAVSTPSGVTHLTFIR